ncbi:MAG TPA: hypothetical protein CFH84_10340 [Sulfurimonas sp. UBA12504]|nr:MAG: hypothetical protein A2019_05975 [Sulfurimonas sp. GWF2_37_8]DAB29289.1 MAG TPA: hypothetical protein CFH84_10340 [Sulfurimonas sp. UBA12504]
MKEKFSNEYPKFQAKIANFVLSQNFTARCKEYDVLFNQMSSIAPDDMRVYAQKSPAFLDARNKSLSIMEQIVSIHRDLKNLFELNKDALGLAYNYDLEAVDKHIAEKLKQSAYLLHQYALVSEAGRKAIEIADNPFLAQAL